MKINTTKAIILITILAIIIWNFILPGVLLLIYGSRPFYEVPAWVMYFFRLRGGV